MLLKTTLLNKFYWHWCDQLMSSGAVNIIELSMKYGISDVLTKEQMLVKSLNDGAIPSLSGRATDKIGQME